MSATQLSLWDNIDLEEGYALLARLDTNGALLKFRDAGALEISEQEAAEGARFSQVWHPIVEFLKSTNDLEESDLQGIWKSFMEPCNPVFKPFKRSLLLLIFSKVMANNRFSDDFQIRAFKQLIEFNLNQKAWDLSQKNADNYPENYHWFFYLAQAEFRVQKAKYAKRHLIQACLLCPDKRFIDSIENVNLQKMAKTMELYQLPFYGWYNQYLELIHLTIIPKFQSQEHQASFEFYQNLYLAEEALKKGANKTAIKYRKELKRLDEDAFKLYLNRI